MPRAGFSLILRDRRYQKKLRKLPLQLQDAAGRTVELLLSEELPNSLNLKPVSPSKTFYEVRINLQYRLVITIEDNTAVLTDICTHDELARYAHD